MPLLPPSSDWSHFLSAIVLVSVRISSLFVFAPVFSSQAIPAKVKATVLMALAAVLAPVVAGLPGARPEIGALSVLGELLVGLIFGVSLSLLTEVALLTGQLMGMQFSFSLVNLLDPNSQIQTPLFGQMFNLLLVTVLVTAGLHRTLLGALLRSFGTLPVGTVLASGKFGPIMLVMAGGVFMAALQLAAPVMAATMLVEIAIAFASRLSPQLHVVSITVPAKTILGYGVLIGSLALWPAFFEARFSGLLDGAQRLLQIMAQQ